MPERLLHRTPSNRRHCLQQRSHRRINRHTKQMTQNKNSIEKTLDIELNDEQLKKIESIQPSVQHALHPISLCSNTHNSQCCPKPKNAVSTIECLQNNQKNLAPPQNTARDEPCCGPRVMPPQNYTEVGLRKTHGITYVDHCLSATDRWGTLKARLGKFRMAYAIEPGLYALGAPDKQSDVLVTANYKLTFDHLRSTLTGRNLWILVLDTWGINVWCAAGKGTFGTNEVIRQINNTQLAQKVTTRCLIVPQLGAPGVAAHRIKKQTGFKIVWGPINAEDICRFIDDNYKAEPSMRQKQFPLKERLALLPIELRPALKLMLIILGVCSPLAALAAPGTYIKGVVEYGVLFFLYLFSGVFSGAVLTPLLLPHLPGRAFSVKSLWTSIPIMTPLTLMLRTQVSLWELIGLTLIATSMAAYAAMNFTGATSYTSISGVKKEMRIAVPVEIGATILGISLWITAQFVA